LFFEQTHTCPGESRSRGSTQCGSRFAGVSISPRSNEIHSDSTVSSPICNAQFYRDMKVQNKLADCRSNPSFGRLPRPQKRFHTKRISRPEPQKPLETRGRALTRKLKILNEQAIHRDRFLHLAMFYPPVRTRSGGDTIETTSILEEVYPHVRNP
jgi:hypothetical protein